ncbi:MAG: efflux RND transporter periplasmic adaptor subunit [Gammaproteobacteria bacterium]|nr:efflux RND transporter periplasmic adaptor subunit [Gammaproteobacteria bacterium]
MKLKYFPPPVLELPAALTALIAVLVLAGCGGEAPPEQEPEVRPVKTILIESTGMESIREFPAVVQATQQADLSFRVSGKLKEFPVKEGDEIEQGDVIARLDDTDFKIALNDARAAYTRALADFKRAKELLPEGHISRSDYDKLDSQNKQTNASLQLARQNVEYTMLKAAFDGVVAKRLVDNFEEVSAKQGIVRLHDTSSLDIIFDIPESLMILVDRSKRGQGSGRKVVARFNAIQNKEFPLTFKEVATDADERTQTYKITFTMSPSERYNILPGMKATVITDTSDIEGKEHSVLLPIAAVSAGADKQATVWLVDEQTMTVKPEQVKVGDMQSDSIEVIGLEPGKRVVTTGVAFLREGMKVSLLETGEQPD